MHFQAGIGRTASHAGLARPVKAAAVSLLVALVMMSAPPIRAQDDVSSKPGVGDARQRVDRFLDAQHNDGMPREIGQILEVSEAARQSGNYAVRHLRSIANTTYDWLSHLRISVVENDHQAIRYDIENCQLLFELLQENNPSAILLADIREMSQILADEDAIGFTTACLTLQLDVEKYDFLYPLVDLKGMTSLIMRQHREGKSLECRSSIRMLEESVALPNIDEPIRKSSASFEAALTHLDKGDDGQAREDMKKAANLISLLNVGTFVCEGNWHLAKAGDALHNRLFGIALASLKKVDSRLEDAEDRAWPEFAAAIGKVREDVSDLIVVASDRKGKMSLSSAKLRAVATRIDKELRIPY